MQLREVRIGSSLGAGEETTLYFGLGQATIATVEVAWPDGTREQFINLPVNQRWQLTYAREDDASAVAAPPSLAMTEPTIAPTQAPVQPTAQPSPTPAAPTSAAPTSAAPTIPSPTDMPVAAPVVPSTTAAAQPLAVPGSSANLLLATAWFDLYLELIETTEGFTPPVAARAIGYGSITLYEALVPVLPEHQSLVGQLNGLTALPPPLPNARYHWPIVANSAMASITRMLFNNTNAANRDAIDLLELQLAERHRPLLDEATFARSAQYGRALAVAIYGWSATDGGHEGQLRNASSHHTAPTGSGLWQPTPPDYATALQPHWGNNRPFVLDKNQDCAAAPPIPYAEAAGSPFHALAQEVYDTVRTLTPEQRIIARYWADDPGQTPTPPGHSLAITTAALRQHGATLALAAETYARVGIALNDAFIGCWRTKYQSNRVRPITYIQQQIDPTWNEPAITDPVTTPPFPEYTSGHSVQSGAAAEVLTALLGEMTFVDTTHTARGFLPRSYRSFWEMANEAAISRLYGGIHYRDAIEVGLVQGQCIGQQVLMLQFRQP